MFKELFMDVIAFKANYFKQCTIDLFKVELLINSVSIFVGILLLLLFNFQINTYIAMLFAFPVVYLFSYIYNEKNQYQISFILYHIASYFLILYLIILYGKVANFQFYFLGICFSIYLYSKEKKSYQTFILYVYLCSFIIANLFNLPAIYKIEISSIYLLSMFNLLFAFAGIAFKAIKYVNLKEKAVEKYENSHLKALETKKRLKDKEAIFNFLFNSSLDGAEFSIQSTINMLEIAYDANTALIDLLKMDKNSIKNMDRLSFSPEVQSNGKSSIAYNEEVKALLEKNNQYRYEWDYINADGEIINTEVTQLRLKENDQIINIAFVKNISDKKKTEKELFESELMYRTLFDNVYDGIKIDVYDKKSRAIINQFINQKLFALLKVKEYDFEVEGYMRFLPKYQSKNKTSLQLIAELKQAFKKKKSLNFRMNLLNANKEPFTADFIALQIETEAIRKVVLITKDVTEIVKKEQIIQKQILSLKKKKNELIKYIESNKQLELFAFRASHDLKAPIVTITKFIDILKKRNLTKFDEESLDYIQFIESSITHLRNLIDDCLNHSRITSKKINIQNINPKQSIQVALNNLKSTIEENNAQITLFSMPDYINADEIKFITLLQNLISNAIKYRKKNIHPLIIIDCIESESHYQFSVSDNGIGIKNENKTKIFDLYETFYEYDKESLDNQENSTGIGLTTCSKLVELHNGRIWVESVYGEGSIFYFIISKNLHQINS